MSVLSIKSKVISAATKNNKQQATLSPLFWSREIAMVTGVWF